MDITDVDRFAEWKREFDAFERTRTLPQLEIVRLPRDHTSGTRGGKPTPQAMVADNDLAVGLLVDAVSHSADWASTAIFVIEDDAQNGPDHVDEQRSHVLLDLALRRGRRAARALHAGLACCARWSCCSGLPPMTPYDAGAAPLDAPRSAPRPTCARSTRSPRAPT